MREILNITKALADPNRLRILAALRCCGGGGEMCACQIIEMLRLAGSTVSKHLSILQQARLVEARKDGRWMHYRLPEKHEASPAVRSALAWVAEALDGQPEICCDQKSLGKILSIEPGELCQIQSQRSKCCSSAPATRAGAKWPKAGRGRSKAM